MVRFNSDVVFIDTSGQVRSSVGDLTLRADNTGTKDIVIGSGTSFRPETDRQINLGSHFLRWKTLYACSGNFTERPTVQESGIALLDEIAAGFSGLFAVQFAKEDAVQSTTSQAFVQVLRLVTAPLKAGTYRVAWSALLSSDDKKEPMQFRVQLDDTIDMVNLTTTLSDVRSNGHRQVMAGFDYQQLSAGLHFIDFDFLSTKLGSTVFAQDVRLEIWRLA